MSADLAAQPNPDYRRTLQRIGRHISHHYYHREQQSVPRRDCFSFKYDSSPGTVTTLKVSKDKGLKSVTF